MSDERRILPIAFQAFCAGALILIGLGWSSQVVAESKSRWPPQNRIWPIGRRRPPTHIIGGTPAEPCKWPWHVALLKTDGSFLCGATLISTNWVLTAGHCLYGKPPDIPIYAALGAHNLSANDAAQLILIGAVTVLWCLRKIPVIHAIFSCRRESVGRFHVSAWTPRTHVEPTNRFPYEPLHAAYDPNDYGVNDLALLELTEPANVSHPCIEAIGLGDATFDPITNGNCWMVGWGRYSYDEDGYSEVPLETRANVIKNDNCQRRWSTSIFFQPTIYSYNVCTFDRQNYTSSCDWDSGSPLQCFDDTYNGGSWVLVGIQSWGSGSCKVYPSVFMRASNYTSWILMNVFRLHLIEPDATTTPGTP